MTNENKNDKTRREINWTAVAVTAGLIGGGILLYKISQSIFQENEQDRELAREILIDWQQEFEMAQDYFQIIYANNRVPTESELALLSSMVEAMKVKEANVQILSRSVFEELQDLAAEIASGLWLVSKSTALLILSGVAARWIVPKIIKEWKNRRGGPPNYGCPICGASYATVDQLHDHVINRHRPAMVATNIQQAQWTFATAPTWVQDAVAADGLYSSIHSNWVTWSPSALANLNWYIIYAIVLGIGSLGTLSNVSFLLLLP